jgi:NAD-dependent SIR2 family protein deacetylase
MSMSEATLSEAAAAGAISAEVGSAGSGGEAECWCCGQQYPRERLVRMGSHPEVAVCFGCAHFLHQQARQREDALRPSIATRLRDALRRGRRLVMDGAGISGR